MQHFLKFLACILISLGSAVYGQCPENIGFEAGSFKGWQIYEGSISRNGDMTLNEKRQPSPRRLALMKASDERLDPYGFFPTTSPNGSNYAVRLGDSDTGRRVDRLVYTLTVPNIPQYALILNYAVVLQNPDGHGDIEQPRFSVKVFNETDNLDVECPAFDFIASQNLPGFQISDVVTDNPRTNGGRDVTAIFYKDWTTTTINLNGYAGKKIRLIFTTNDCARGAHFGYAYFDINEQCNSPITGNTYCADQSLVTLKGPRGFYSYKWYKSDNMTNVLDSGQTLTITPVPPDGTKYSLVIDALPGLGCRDTLHTIVVKSNNSFIFRVEPVLYFCRGTTFNLKSPLVTNGSSGVSSFEYYTDPVSEEYLRDPDKIKQNGIYYIKATNDEGCTNTLPVELRYYDDALLTTTNLTAEYPVTVDLSTSYSREPGYQYLYYTDISATKELADFQHVQRSGTYYIKAVSSSGCEKVEAVKVEITPPPPYVISGPTAFTPNNDGINDLFGISINGYVDFGVLSIYNRAGQFLFKTNKQTNLWDGYWKGKPLPTGTYYWVFEGSDQYYRTKVIKTGYVSIIK